MNLILYVESGKIYEVISATVKQSWFGLATAKIYVTEEIKKEHKKSSFKLEWTEKDKEPVPILVGHILTEEGGVNSRNIITLQSGNKKDKKRAVFDLELDEEPVFYSAWGGEKKTIFHGKSNKIEVSASDLLSCKFEGSAFPNCKIKVLITYQTKGEVRIGVEHKFYDEKSLQEVLLGWPVVGDIHEYSGNSIVVSESSVKETAAGRIDASMTILRNYTILHQEIWDISIGPDSEENVEEINLRLDLGKDGVGFMLWETGKQYCFDSSVIYEGNLWSCIQSHQSKNFEEEREKCWRRKSSYAGNIAKDSFYQSENGRRMCEKIFLCATLELCRKHPDRVSFKLPSSKAAYIELGDQIELEGEKYTVVEYEKRYQGGDTEVDCSTTVTAYNFFTEEFNACLKNTPKVSKPEVTSAKPELFYDENGVIRLKFYQVLSKTAVQFLRINIDSKRGAFIPPADERFFLLRKQAQRYESEKQFWGDHHVMIISSKKASKNNVPPEYILLPVDKMGTHEMRIIGIPFGRTGATGEDMSLDIDKELLNRKAVEIIERYGCKTAVFTGDGIPLEEHKGSVIGLVELFIPFATAEIRYMGIEPVTGHLRFKRDRR